MHRILPCLFLACGRAANLNQLDTRTSSDDATCYDKNNTVFSCPAKCFCEPTYSEDQVLDTDNIEYSEKYNLLLHLFEPPSSDEAKRPAMVMIHGGGFKSGNRNDKKGIIDWCHQLAMRGYVAVSIDYRLDHPKAGPGLWTDVAAHHLPPRMCGLTRNAKHRRRASTINIILPTAP